MIFQKRKSKCKSLYNLKIISLLQIFRRTLEKIGFYLFYKQRNTNGALLTEVSSISMKAVYEERMANVFVQFQ